MAAEHSEGDFPDVHEVLDQMSSTTGVYEVPDHTEKFPAMPGPGPLPRPWGDDSGRGICIGEDGYQCAEGSTDAGPVPDRLPPIIVPDHFPTIAEAVDSIPESEQRHVTILLRAGEFTVGNQLANRQCPVHFVGLGRGETMIRDGVSLNYGGSVTRLRIESERINALNLSSSGDASIDAPPTTFWVEDSEVAAVHNCLWVGGRATVRVTNSVLRGYSSDRRSRWGVFLCRYGSALLDTCTVKHCHSSVTVCDANSFVALNSEFEHNLEAVSLYDSGASAVVDCCRFVGNSIVFGARMADTSLAVVACDFDSNKTPWSTSYKNVPQHMLVENLPAKSAAKVI
eukprot:m.214082 g.214082  ORF g.214082 m.214082 type:complete len:341 (-) comp18617_c0_seq3:91-1113(-)